MTVKEFCEELGIDVRNFNGTEDFKIYVPEVNLITVNCVDSQFHYDSNGSFIDSKNKIIYLTERI